jgi:hypothetical protein
MPPHHKIEFEAIAHPDQSGPIRQRGRRTHQPPDFDCSVDVTEAPTSMPQSFAESERPRSIALDIVMMIVASKYPTHLAY